MKMQLVINKVTGSLFSQRVCAHYLRRHFFKQQNMINHRLNHCAVTHIVQGFTLRSQSDFTHSRRPHRNGRGVASPQEHSNQTPNTPTYSVFTLRKHLSRRRQQQTVFMQSTRTRRTVADTVPVNHAGYSKILKST